MRIVRSYFLVACFITWSPNGSYIAYLYLGKVHLRAWYH
jgi:hypothetical protein